MTDQEGGSSGADSFGRYLGEIGRRQLLSPTDEVALAHAIAEGHAAEAALASAGASAPEPEPAEQDRLALVAAAGRRAKQHFIEANLRLVVSVAKRYAGRGVPLADLVAEGNIGLMRAVERFDPERGFRFSTFATWWIRQAVTRALDRQGRVIRLPDHVAGEIAVLRRSKVELQQVLGRDPTGAELGAAAGIDEERVTELMAVAQADVSLEAPVGEDGDELVDLRPDPGPDPGEVVSVDVLREEVLRLLDDLSDRERTVLELRYGLAGGEILPLEAVAERMGITRERVRQIEMKALHRLRQPAARRHLDDSAAASA